MNSFYNYEELKRIGLKSFGKNVIISKKSSIYGAENISIGSNVRIDDFCILSGTVEIGDFVHISAYCALYGKGGIKVGNFCGLSPRSTIYSATDDFSGDFMISPMVPDKFTNVKIGKVILEDYVQLGANSIIMPNIKIFQGAVTGSFSLVLQDLKSWTINFGIPCKFYKNRNKNILKFLERINHE